MYYIKKTIEISSSHRLNLSYESKCQNLHGHNWIITIYVKSLFAKAHYFKPFIRKNRCRYIHQRNSFKQ